MSVGVLSKNNARNTSESTTGRCAVSVALESILVSKMSLTFDHFDNSTNESSNASVRLQLNNAMTSDYNVY